LLLPRPWRQQVAAYSLLGLARSLPKYILSFNQVAADTFKLSALISITLSNLYIASLARNFFFASPKLFCPVKA